MIEVGDRVRLIEDYGDHEAGFEFTVDKIVWDSRHGLGPRPSRDLIYPLGCFRYRVELVAKSELDARLEASRKPLVFVSGKLRKGWSEAFDEAIGGEVVPVVGFEDRPEGDDAVVRRCAAVVLGRKPRKGLREFAEALGMIVVDVDGRPAVEVWDELGRELGIIEDVFWPDLEPGTEFTIGSDSRTRRIVEIHDRGEVTKGYVITDLSLRGYVYTTPGHYEDRPVTIIEDNEEEG